MRVAPVEQARAEQKPDRDGRDDDEKQQRAGLPFLQSRLEAAQNERDPEQQPYEQIDLPEAAEIEIFIALVAEPEIDRPPPLCDG